MEHEKLLEKHAAALGLKDVKIEWTIFNGPDAMNNALISDSVDVVAGGTPGLLTLYNRTKGTPNEVKGISALSSQPFLLNTRSDNIKSIADLKDADRVALPAVKVSIQAVVLQMAAAKQWGEAIRQARSAHRLDVAAGFDHRAAVRLRRGQLRIQRAAVPAAAARKARIHTILNSFDVMDGPATFTVAWTSSRFRDRESGALQGAGRRAEGSDRDRR